MTSPPDSPRLDETGRLRLASTLPRPVAYVLGGGAAYGAVQLGMLQALADTDLSPDLVVGTSVGSLNGAVLAADPVAGVGRLEELWGGITRDDVFGRALRTAFQAVRNRPWVVDPAPLRGLVERSVAAHRFEDLAVPFVAVTTDLDTGETVPLETGRLVDALMASAAIPGVFPWVDRDGRRLVDGGVTANVALDVARSRGAASLVVLDCGFTITGRDRADTLAAVLVQTAAIMAGSQVRRELAPAAEALPVVYLPGGWPLRTRPDDFLRVAEQADAARRLTAQFLAGLAVTGPGLYGTPPYTR